MNLQFCTKLGAFFTEIFLGTFSRVLSLTAAPRSPPVLQNDLPKNTSVEIGDNATMKCIVLVSGTLPEFRWLKWDKSITSLPRSYDNFQHGSYQLIDPHYYKTIQVGDNYGVELRITNVTEDDFALYTCFVSNHIGENHNSAFLSRYVKATTPVQGGKFFITGLPVANPVLNRSSSLLRRKKCNCVIPLQ